MIIMPAADVLEVAQQAPEHAPEPEAEGVEAAEPAEETESEG
jgi:hypothetical protein